MDTCDCMYLFVCVCVCVCVRLRMSVIWLQYTDVMIKKIDVR